MPPNGRNTFSLTIWTCGMVFVEPLAVSLDTMRGRELPISEARRTLMVCRASMFSRVGAAPST